MFLIKSTMYNSFSALVLNSHIYVTKIQTLTYCTYKIVYITCMKDICVFWFNLFPLNYLILVYPSFADCHRFIINIYGLGRGSAESKTVNFGPLVKTHYSARAYIIFFGNISFSSKSVNTARLSKNCFLFRLWISRKLLNGLLMFKLWKTVIFS